MPEAGEQLATSARYSQAMTRMAAQGRQRRDVLTGPSIS